MLPTDAVVPLLRSGEEALHAGRHDDAQAHYEHVLELEPLHYGARLNLGVALIRLGRFDDAERHLEHLLRGTEDTEPEFQVPVQHRLLLARAYLGRDDAAGRVHVLARMLVGSCHPTGPLTRLTRAARLKRASRLPRPAPTKRLRALWPWEGRATSLLAIVLGRGQAAPALPDAPGHMEMFDLLLGALDGAAASQAAAFARAQHGDDAETRYNLAVYLARGQPDAAFQELAHALVDRSLHSWSAHDPWITALRDEHAERFRQIRESA
jgi:tetratricopeptide (TPR) repeat protein